MTSVRAQLAKNEGVTTMDAGKEAESSAADAESSSAAESAFDESALSSSLNTSLLSLPSDASLMVSKLEQAVRLIKH